MKKIQLRLLFNLLSLLSLSVNGQNTLQFNSLDSLFKYAEQNSSIIKNAEQQSLLAKWTKLASVGNTINLRSPISASWTNNIELPVSYLPAPIFGGQPGDVKAVSLGQQYVTTYAITPQIDIINPSLLVKIKSAELNKQLTEINNLVAKKALYESISASYYNIVSSQNQLTEMEKNLSAADSILQIAKNKYTLGIIREQDLNNSTINWLNVKDKLNQVKISIEQQYNNLKILCDIKSENTVQVTEKLNSSIEFNAPKTASSSLQERQSKTQEQFFKSDLASNRWNSFSPTLSLIFNQSWQRNSNSGFFDGNTNKFNSQYIGLKLTVPFPLDVNKLSQNYTSQINYVVSTINANHNALQNQINNKQLDLDYQKANSTYLINKQITDLKDINYSKSLNQYKEGIISTDILLTAFTDKINAQLNYLSAISSLKYAESKININNTIQ